MGTDFGLRDPGFGAGAILALRPSIAGVRFVGAFSAGRLAVPVTTNDKERAWTIAFHGGLGFALIKWLALEARTRYERYFDMQAGAPDDSWTLEAGLVVTIP